MLRNYFSVIARNILRNKTYSLINLLGLSLGTAVCLIILQYVRFEESFDTFHSKADHLYRVIREFTNSDGLTQRDAAQFAPAGEALKSTFPEVTGYVRITPEYSKVVLSNNDRKFEVDKVYYADSTFFSLFDFKLLQGDRTNVLTDARSVVISRTTAEKYFGPMDSWQESPIGKILVMNNNEVLKVTGIMEDFPPNSHFRANALLSFTTFLLHNDPSQSWGWNDFYTYIDLKPGTDYKRFESKLPGIIAKYKGKDSKDRMIVQSLKDIHLHSNVGYELSPNGSAETVYFLSIIAVAILIIAWVNYINLATARAGRRAREIGVRKVSGATRDEVMIQFLLEAFSVNLVALVLAIVIVAIVLPPVSQVLDKPLRFSLLEERMFLIYAGFIYIGGSVASGLYPAILLSSFKPVTIFKSSMGFGKGNSGLRHSLVIFQFMISAGLITGTLIIQNQMAFIRNKDLGYNYDKTIILNASSTQKNDSLFYDGYLDLRATLMAYPEIENITVSSALPGRARNDIDFAGGLRMVGDSQDINYGVTSYRVDENFIDVFHLQLIAGKKFSKVSLGNDEQLIVNRKAAELFGFNNPDDIVGKRMHFWGNIREVVGVIENYHHKSLKNSFEPEVIRNRIDNMLYITVRLNQNGTANLGEVIHRLNNVWNEKYPNDPFTYFFLEDNVRDQYKADAQFNAIFGIFSAFSMFIACLGLFGLVAYSVSVRFREIGVRKVLGASVSGIVMLFWKSYMRLLVIAFIIGIPISYYVLTFWLDDFAYRGKISWTLFVIPILIVSVLAGLAVAAQTVKAARVNPVDSLRCE